MQLEINEEEAAFLLQLLNQISIKGEHAHILVEIKKKLENSS